MFRIEGPFRHERFVKLTYSCVLCRICIIIYIQMNIGAFHFLPTFPAKVDLIKFLRRNLNSQPLGNCLEYLGRHYNKHSSIFYVGLWCLVYIWGLSCLGASRVACASGPDHLFTGTNGADNRYLLLCLLPHI